MIVPDPLHFIIAFGPLAMYLAPLGLINLARRPSVTTGARDFSALAVGISGFMLAGPMELFMPEGTAAALHGLVWVLLLALYTLVVTLVVLLMRPKLVIYNGCVDEVRPVLVDVVSRLDPEARWAGDSAVLPNLHVQFSLLRSDLLRTTELVAGGNSLDWPSQDVYTGWRKLEIALRKSLREVPVTPRPLGFGMLAMSFFFVSIITYFLVRHPSSIATSLWDFLRM